MKSGCYYRSSEKGHGGADTQQMPTTVAHDAWPKGTTEMVWYVSLTSGQKRRDLNRMGTAAWRRRHVSTLSGAVPLISP